MLGSTDDELCPVSALFKYLHLRGRRAGPLFIWEDNNPLTRSTFVAAVRSALSSAGYTRSAICQYAGHSFRAGAASTAAAMGLEDSLIKTLGRWESSAYLIYLRLPRHDLQRVARQLSQYQCPTPKQSSVRT